MGVEVKEGGREIISAVLGGLSGDYYMYTGEFMIRVGSWISGRRYMLQGRGCGLWV